MTLSAGPALVAVCDLCGAQLRLAHGGDLRLVLAAYRWRVQPSGRVLCARCDGCGRTGRVQQGEVHAPPP